MKPIVTTRQLFAESVYRRLDGGELTPFDEVLGGFIKHGWSRQEVRQAFDDLVATQRIELTFGGLAGRRRMVRAINGHADEAKPVTRCP